MSNRQPNFYAASYLVLQKDGKVLLQHRTKTGWMDNHWGMPAGHIEGKESVFEALKREIQEELGVELIDSAVKLSHVMHRVSTDNLVYFDFFFTTDKWKGEIKSTEPEKHAEVKWFPVTELPPNIIPYLARVLERIQKQQFFSEDDSH